MKSICIIIPYFGSLPNYFSLWLNSCKNNSTINWLLVGDHFPNELPSNVNLISCTLDEMKKRIQERLGFNISLEKPYKLCDYKPAYGLIFQDFLGEYDFWGYGDIDLIYGNLRQFITEELLLSYDRIYAHGHLSIVRNSPALVRAFQNEYEDCIDYRTVFSSPQNFTFDEWGQSKWGGYDQICQHNGLKVYNKKEYADIYVKYYGLMCDFGGNDIELKKEKQKKRVFYRYENGRLTQWWNKAELGKELAYIHLQKRKMMVDEEISINHYFIYPNRFTSEKKSIFLERGYNPVYLRLLRKQIIKKAKYYLGIET